MWHQKTLHVVCRHKMLEQLTPTMTTVLPHLSASSLRLCLAPCGSPGSAAVSRLVPASLPRSGCWWGAGTCPGKTAGSRTASARWTVYPLRQAWCLDSGVHAVIRRGKAAFCGKLLYKTKICTSKQSKSMQETRSAGEAPADSWSR